MSSLNESKKRDFIAQLIVMMDKNAKLLIDKGFNPKAKIAELKADKILAIKEKSKQFEKLTLFFNLLDILSRFSSNFADSGLIVITRSDSIITVKLSDSYMSSLFEILIFRITLLLASLTKGLFSGCSKKSRFSLKIEFSVK